MIDKLISHFRILETLGHGGMGVVYKAEDTRLQRTVALKFLSPELTGDPEAKKRFIREAQAASSLQHTNICTIHDIGETDDGRMYICMDYYEGKTLKQLIADKALPVDQVKNISIQIARGLARAHEEGIVHRDIKPANIIITDRSEVKILDFGLAKLAGKVQITKDSSTLGTVAYMSPEQAKADKVDHRTDIWSLGVVMYEMIAGVLPFRGEYEQAILYSILNEDPEPLTRPASGNNDLFLVIEQVIKKALAKNASERYQWVEEILDDLEFAKRVSQYLPKQSALKKPMPRFILNTLAVVLLLMVIFIAYWLIRPNGEMEIQITRTLPLTTAPGLEQDPTWSPEGTRIAYASDENGNMDVWVRQVAAGQRINLTQDHEGYDGKPAWSPDGEWIAFISERDGGGIFLIPALGGIPKRLVSLTFSTSLYRIGIIPDVSWSPDGSELVYAIDGSLYTISSSGGMASALSLPPTGLIVGFAEPRWSPDRKRIACTGFIAPGVSTSQIWSIDLSGSDPLPVTEGKYLDHNPVWSMDGRRLFFISDRGGSLDVWWIPVNDRGGPAGAAQSLTAGAGVGAIALSKNGTNLAFAKVVEYSNIWSIPIISDRRVRLDEALPLTSENHYIEALDISPDGQRIVFDSNRHGNMDIWVMRKNGTELRQLTIHQAHDWSANWSSDGEKILFHSLRNGNRDLFEIPVVGGAVTQLTSHSAEDLVARWSPDGQRIAFLSNRTGNMDIWTISSNGNRIKQLTHDNSQEIAPVWSPDGNEMVFSSNRTGYYELFHISVGQSDMPETVGKPLQLTSNEWATLNSLNWTEDKKTIFAYGVGGPDNKGPNLWFVSVTDGSARPLLDFQGSLMEPSHSMSSDGERLYFPLMERIGDLWMAELMADD